jgi:hypothetical protein
MAPERITIEVDGDDVETVTSQIPSAETIAPQTRLVVLAGKSRGWLDKLLPPRNAPPKAAIGSALLARGYVRIGAGDEGGRSAVWGESSDAATTEPSAGPEEACPPSR